MGIVKAVSKTKDATEKAIEFLKKYDSAEVTTKLKGKDREVYLRALKEAQGDKNARMNAYEVLPDTFYHGSFRDIEKFDPKKFSPGAAVGKGVYVTTDPDDAFNNYARASGPDVSSKIAQAFDEIVSRGNQYDTGAERDRLMRAARIKAIGTSNEEGIIYPLKIRANNIADLGPSGGRSHFDFSWSGDENPDLSDDAKKMFAALDKAAKKYPGLAPHEVFWRVIEENDFPREGDLWKALSKSDALEYAEDAKGNLVSNEVKRMVLEGLGFDAIELNPVTKGKPAVSFGRHYQADPDARHITVFNPNQVRSANAAFDTRFKKSPLIMAGKAGVIGGAAMGGADQAMADMAPDQVARKAADIYDKYVAQPIVSTAKKTMTPTLNVRGQEYPTGSMASDIMIEGGLDPSNALGGAGDVIELIRMLRDMGKKEQVAQ